jgi:hypothetical protein
VLEEPGPVLLDRGEGEQVAEQVHRVPVRVVLLHRGDLLGERLEDQPLDVRPR